MTGRRARTVGIGLVAGLGATLVKSAGEPRLQKLFEARVPPAPAEKLLVGADPGDHPENMPPAAGIRAVGRAVTGAEPPAAVVSGGSQAVHLTFGTVGGALYALLVDRFPLANVGGGIPAGLGLYGATHASILALIGLQPPPTRMPQAAVLWEATSHAGYGLTLELLRRLLDAALPGH